MRPDDEDRLLDIIERLAQEVRRLSERVYACEKAIVAGSHERVIGQARTDEDRRKRDA